MIALLVGLVAIFLVSELLRPHVAAHLESIGGWEVRQYEALRAKAVKELTLARSSFEEELARNEIKFWDERIAECAARYKRGSA